MDFQLVSALFKRSYKYLASGVSLLVVLVIAFPSRFYFLNDDFIHIPLAGKGDFIHGTLYRPLSDLSLWVDYRLWGKNAFGYHLTNLLIHLINSLLVYKLAQKVYVRYSVTKLSETKAFFAGLLFLVYGYHSEPLFWIIGRGATLATTFFLFAFYFYYKSEQWKGHVYFALFFFVVGLFAYETIWVFPAVVTLDYIIKRDRVNRFKDVLLIWLVFSFFFGFRFFITGNMPDDYEVGLVYGFNLSQLIYKYNTLVARCFLPPMQSGILFASMYVIILLCLLYSNYRIRNKSIYFNSISLLIAVLPTISLGIDTHDSESERYIYLATVFAVFIIVEIFSFLRKPLFISAFTLMYFFHIFKLFETSNSYEFSSMVANCSLQFIKSSSSDTLILYNLPKQYKGALIFRIGLPNAIKWINNQSPHTVTIVSQLEYEKKFGILNQNKKSIYDIRKYVAKIQSTTANQRLEVISSSDSEIFFWWKDSIYKVSR